MKKALVLPKIIVTVILLAAAIIISAPVVGVVSNRFFGGGIVELEDGSIKEYHSNAPAEGRIHYILGTAAGSKSADGSLEKGYYYYLMLKGGTRDSSSNKADSYVLVKAIDGSDEYTGMNDVFRASANGISEEGFPASGVFKEITSEEESLAKKIISDSGINELKVSEFVLDLSKPVVSYTSRFYISLIFYAAGIFGIYLIVSAINKNAYLEDIEDKRIMFKIEQDRKSGNTNDDGSDKMFGDSEASFGVTPRSAEGSDMLGESPGNSGGGYKPAFQSQGGKTENDPFSGSMMGGSGGFLDDNSYQGGGSSGGFLDDNSYQGGGSSGGFLDDNSYQGGGSNDFSDGFFGGGQQTRNDEDYDGFFGGR